MIKDNKRDFIYAEEFKIPLHATIRRLPPSEEARRMVDERNNKAKACPLIWTYSNDCSSLCYYICFFNRETRRPCPQCIQSIASKFIAELQQVYAGN